MNRGWFEHFWRMVYFIRQMNIMAKEDVIKPVLFIMMLALIAIILSGRSHVNSRATMSPCRGTPGRRWFRCS
jgi:hypothetical protein